MSRTWILPNVIFIEIGSKGRDILIQKAFDWEKLCHRRHIKDTSIPGVHFNPSRLIACNQIAGDGLKYVIATKTD